MATGRGAALDFYFFVSFPNGLILDALVFCAVTSGAALCGSYGNGRAVWRPGCFGPAAALARGSIFATLVGSVAGTAVVVYRSISCSGFTYSLAGCGRVLAGRALRDRAALARSAPTGRQPDKKGLLFSSLCIPCLQNMPKAAIAHLHITY